MGGSPRRENGAASASRAVVGSESPGVGSALAGAIGHHSKLVKKASARIDRTRLAERRRYAAMFSRPPDKPV
jgi:hypothetical protein